MQEEVTQKAIALTMRAERLTTNLLKEAVRAYLRNRESRSVQSNAATGKTTVRKLLGEGQGASTISVHADCIKGFERIAKKYQVQYAIKKDKSQVLPQYTVFFKAKDTDVIQAAFKEFVGKNDRKKDRPSLRQKLKEKVQSVSHENQHKERQRSRGKNHAADR